MLRLPLLTAALLIALCSTAHAAGIQITPSTLDVSARPGANLPPITVSNGTGRAVKVRALAVPVAEGLDGMPIYDLSAKSRRAGTRLLSLSAPGFRIAPGGTSRLGVRVSREAPSPGAYAAIVFIADPVGGPRVRRVDTLVPRIRVTANVLLRLPGAVSRRGAIDAIRSAQGSASTLDFTARLHNTGNLHVRARGAVRIQAQDGHVVARAPLDPSVVLPGARRDVTATVRTLLPAGTYSATAEAKFGAFASHRTVRFRLVGPNQLPTAKLSLAALSADAPRPEKPFDITFQLANRGTASFSGTARAVLTPIGGGRAIELPPFQTSALAPGQAVTGKTRAPGVLAGLYRLQVEVSSNGFTLAEASRQIRVEEPPPASSRLADWLAQHAVVIVVGLLVLMLAVVVVAVVAVRRSRSKVRA